MQLISKKSRREIEGCKRASNVNPDGHTGYDWLKVQVTALPENGKANCALLKILAKHFKIARSRLHILRGKKDRFKHILFQDLSNPGDLPPI